MKAFKYTVLEIQFLSDKSTAVSRIRKNFDQFFILIRAMQATTVLTCLIKSIQVSKVFCTVYTY